MSYFDNYTDDEIKTIVSHSQSYADFARKIGYANSPSGDTIKALKKKLENFDTSHFLEINNNNRVQRTPEDIFIKNSTASQSTVRRFYLKGKYSPYTCSICGQKPFWNNQSLTLILDHINGINNDDQLDNLRWVCPNCNSQLDTTGSKNPQRKKFKKKYYCQKCGKEISKYATYCAICNAEKKIIPIEDMLVSREELKSLIRTESFVSIGKQFNVTDNAIRKWCKKLNLPFKKTDIKKYSDKEWELI